MTLTLLFTAFQRRHFPALTLFVGALLTLSPAAESALASDFIEEARAGGMPLRQALVHAGLVRLRPVIVTVLSTVCGLIPLAQSGGGSSGGRSPRYTLSACCARRCSRSSSSRSST